MPINKNMIFVLTNFLFAMIRHLGKTDKRRLKKNFSSGFQRFQVIMFSSIDSGTGVTQNIHGGGNTYKKQNIGSREQQIY